LTDVLFGLITYRPKEHSEDRNDIASFLSRNSEGDLISDFEARVPGTDVVITMKGPSRTFLAKVAFVADSNEDGTNRQEILKKCQKGEPLRFVLETEDPDDPRGVAVFRTTGERLGYIEEYRSGGCWLHLARGGEMSASIFALGSPEHLRSLNRRHKRDYELYPEAVEMGCLVTIWEGGFRKGYEPFYEKSQATESLIREAEQKEKDDPEWAIETYRRAIDEIRQLDSIGPLAKAWRMVRYPVLALANLLEKSGKFEEALQVIEAYESYNDRPLGLTKGAQGSIPICKHQLLVKLGRADAASVKKAPRQSKPPVKVLHYCSEIRGVTYKNKDGTKRQEIIEGLAPFSPLNLEPEENSEEHGYTTKVTNLGGEQLGYLMKSIASAYLRGKKKGHRFAAFVDEILEWEAYQGRTNYGVSALMIEVTPKASDDEIREYIYTNFARRGPLVEGLLLKAFGLEPPALPVAQPVTSLPVQPASAQKVESPPQASPQGRAKSGCLGVIILLAVCVCLLILA